MHSSNTDAPLPRVFPHRARRSSLLGAALVALLAAACGPAAAPLTPPPPLPPETAQVAKPAVDAPLEVADDPAAAARIGADVTYFASPELAGRGTGEPGARMAADYMAKRFAELKIEPLGDRDDHGQLGFLQRFQARVGAAAESPALTVEQNGKTTKEPPVDAASMITADGSASQTGSGEAIFVGYGITAAALGWDDYAGSDVAGKVVVILSGAPDVTLEEAGPPHGGPANPHGAPGGDPHAAAGANPHGAGANPHGAGPNPHGAPGGDPHAAAGPNPHGAPGGDPHAAAPGNPHGEGPNPHAMPPGDPHAMPPGDPHAMAAAHGGGPRKNALRDFGSIRYKIRTAREHNAAAVLLVAAGEELPAAPTDASSMGIPAVVLKQSAAAKLFPSLKLDKKPTWDTKKATKAKALSKAKYSLTTRVVPVMADAWNVVATIPARAGSKSASEWVVIGAHYDHLGHGGNANSRAPGVIAIHPGADDNASGAALLLEVARRISALPRKPDRNIAFIGFSAEEVGIIGSRHWVEHAPIDVKSITAMINADMVGRLREGKILVDGTATAAAWPEITKKASEGLNLDIAFGSEGYGASDHSSFTAARVPVAFLFTGTHDDYHKPSDTADKINTQGEATIATLASRMLLGVAQREERMAFVDAPADPQRGMRGGFRVSMGTVPDYAFTGKGMKLTGVRPDAPAARAGIQAGDIIVKVGPHDIGNVHDFMYALGDLEPGREVVVEVDRAGTRIPLKVIPAPSNR